MSIEATKPRVEIRYCVKCRWMLRAAWLAQELLSTFEEEIGGVALVPGGVNSPVRAFRQGWRRGLFALLVPTVGAILAARTGARGVAITWALLGAAYAVLLVLTLV